MIKKSIFLLLLLCMGLSMQAQEQPVPTKKWTLQECVQYALDHNISIAQSQLDLKAAKIDKTDAIGNYLPTLNGSMNNSWNTGLTQNVKTGVLQEQTTRNYSLNLTAGITLFNGLRNLKEWQRAKLSQLASKYSLEEMKNNIMLNVANAYLNVLVNKEQVKVLKQQHGVTKKQLERTRALIGAGAAPAGDSLEIKANYANELQQIITAENTVKIALINLAQLLQIQDYKDFDVADMTVDVPISTIMSKTPEEIVASAFENRYEIKVAKKNLDLANKDVEIARSAYYPRLSGFVNYNTRESNAERIVRGGIDPNNPTQVIGQVEGSGQNVVTPNYFLEALNPLPFFDQLSANDGISFGLSLSIPILNGLSTRNNVKRSKIDVQRKEIALKQAKLDLESNVYQAYVDVKGAAKAYLAAQVAVVAEQKAYDYATEKYDHGMMNAFDFAQAKSNLSQAKTKMVRAKFDYIFKIKVLEFYFGVDPKDIRL